MYAEEHLGKQKYIYIEDRETKIINLNIKVISLSIFFTYNKQLLDEVFLISGIIKVEVSVISRTEGRG